MRSEATGERARRIGELHQEGHRTAVIAERLRISDRTVYRWLNRLYGDGWKTGQVVITDEARQTVIRLSRDQVPPKWIAETVQLSVDSVDTIRRHAGTTVDPEWPSICQQILRNPALSALHKEFAP